MKKLIFRVPFLIYILLLYIVPSSMIAPQRLGLQTEKNTPQLNGATAAPNQSHRQVTVEYTGPVIPRYRVVIDAGHGGDDYGAESITHRNEADFTLAVALRIRTLLSRESTITLYLTRSDNTFIGLDDRVSMANQWAADVFLSIHANIDKSSSTRGTVTFYNRDDSLPFAQIIQEYVQKATGFPDRHIEYNDYRVIKNTTMPAALVEVGFLSNAIEDKALFKESMQDNIAAAIVEGIREYLGIPDKSK